MRFAFFLSPPARACGVCFLYLCLVWGCGDNLDVCVSCTRSRSKGPLLFWLLCTSFNHLPCTALNSTDVGSRAVGTCTRLLGATTWPTIRASATGRPRARGATVSDDASRQTRGSCSLLAARPGTCILAPLRSSRPHSLSRDEVARAAAAGRGRQVLANALDLLQKDEEGLGASAEAQQRQQLLVRQEAAVLPKMETQRGEEVTQDDGRRGCSDPLRGTRVPRVPREPRAPAPSRRGRTCRSRAR